MTLPTEATDHYSRGASAFEHEKRLNMLPGPACEVSQLYFARINLCGVSWGDIVLALKDCRKKGTWHDWEDWHRCWVARGEVFERQGEGALAAGHVTTGREALLRATACYHFAEFMYFANPAVKNATRARVTATFHKAIPFLEHDVSTLRISHRGVTIPNYLMWPSRGNSPFPCVILNNGMESAKEAELYAFAQAFLKRGMAVLLFDGPGQGEHLGHHGMELRWEDVMGSVLDALVQESQVDVNRIGTFGVSFGGYLALRGAAFHQDRIKAVVNLSGCYDIDNFGDLRGMVLDDFRYVFNLSSEEQMTRLAIERLNLRDAPSLRRPLLTIHSKTDSLFPFESAQRVNEWAAGEKELIPYENEWHVCTNHMSEFVPYFCDWMGRKLLAAERTASSPGVRAEP